MAGRNTYDINLYRGDTKTLRLNFTDGAVAGDRIRMMVKDGLDGEALISKEVTLGGSGTVVITIESADTQQLEPGTYIYDIELVRGDRVVTLVEKSKMKIRGDVTHD